MTKVHKCRDYVPCEYDVSDLNPRAQATKASEMTVIRCLGLIDAFEALASGQDWTDVPAMTYRRVLGNDHYAQRAVISEVYNRFKAGRIYGEVLALYENLPPTVQKREEIKHGIRNVRKHVDS